MIEMDLKNRQMQWDAALARGWYEQRDLRYVFATFAQRLELKKDEGFDAALSGVKRVPDMKVVWSVRPFVDRFLHPLNDQLVDILMSDKIEKKDKLMRIFLRINAAQLDTSDISYSNRVITERKKLKRKSLVEYDQKSAQIKYTESINKPRQKWTTYK